MYSYSIHHIKSDLLLIKKYYLPEMFVHIIFILGKLPTWRRLLYMVCGYEKPQEITRTEEEKLEEIRLLTHIKEEPKLKLFVNVNALLLMCIGIFLWGFFA